MSEPYKLTLDGKPANERESERIRVAIEETIFAVTGEKRTASDSCRDRHDRS